MDRSAAKFLGLRAATAVFVVVVLLHPVQGLVTITLRGAKLHYDKSQRESLDCISRSHLVGTCTSHGVPSPLWRLLAEYSQRANPSFVTLSRRHGFSLDVVINRDEA